MYTLIVALLFSLAFTYFATQNAAPVNVHFANTYLVGIPLYWAIFGALIVGVVVAAIIATVEAISTRRMSTSSQAYKEGAAFDRETLEARIATLQAQIKQLEKENITLQQELNRAQQEAPFYHPEPSGLIERLRARFV